jgi:hypothetical protein
MGAILVGLIIMCVMDIADNSDSFIDGYRQGRG